MGIMDGVYTLIYPHSDGVFYDADCPVEGYREGWAERVIANARHLPREQRAGFVYALRMLAVAEVTPPAFGRSIPIWRFQVQLERVLREVES